MESNQTSSKTKQVIMDAEVLDILIGEQDYTERLHKYSSKLQVQKLENPVTKVVDGYYVTNTSDETISIIGEGPIDIVKHRDVLFLTSDNKVKFKLPASKSCVLNHNEFMWLSCKPEISFVYSNGEINTLCKEDELEGIDIYTLSSKLEFIYNTEKRALDISELNEMLKNCSSAYQEVSETSENEITDLEINDDDDNDLSNDWADDIEEDEPDDGTVQIIYQGISDMEYIYSDEDEEYLTDEEFEELEAELAAEEAEEVNKNFNLTIAEYKKACCGGTLAEACIKELLEKVVDNLIKTELNTKLHKYTKSLQATNLFIFDHGDPVTQGYKVRNISNETVYIKGARLGKNEDTYKMLRLTTDGNVEFILQANDEFLMNPDEFIWLCLQPEIAFEFSDTYLRDPMVTDKTQNIAYEIIKNNFRLF